MDLLDGLGNQWLHAGRLGSYNFFLRLKKVGTALFFLRLKKVLGFSDAARCGVPVGLKSYPQFWICVASRITWEFENGKGIG